MSNMLQFTTEEQNKIRQLKELLTESVVALDALWKAWRQAPSRSIWIDLLKHVEEHESQRLLRLNKKLDLKRALVRGVAWKTEDEVLFYTWPDADDCKRAPKGALTILLVVDPLTGRLKPHRALIIAAHWMLGMSPSSCSESESGIFLKQLNQWQRLAERNLAKGRSSPKFQELLEDIDAHQDAADRRRALDKARNHFLTIEAKASPRRKNDTAHKLATELSVLCDDLRNDMHAPQHDLESRFWLINQALRAAHLADLLERAANKSTARNIFKMLEKRGPDLDPFAEAVRAACESCWIPTPWKKPSVDQILEAMDAVIKKEIDGSWVVPKNPDTQTWKKHPRKHFDNAVMKWATSKGALLADVKPTKGNTKRTNRCQIG